MSAFMVSRRHIDYLVTAAVASELAGDADECGRMLWRECLNSLKYRYPDDRDGGRPGPARFRDGDVDAYTFTAAVAPGPLELHSLIRCYSYQSCEHPGWESSQAAFLMEVMDPMPGAESDTDWWGPPVEEEREARIAELTEQRDNGSDYGPDEARELAELTGTEVQLPGTGSHDRQA